MILKIKANQVSKVHRLVRELCANCIDGNCLQLDDGEKHKCVQFLCISGICCNYFKRAVLPANKKTVPANLKTKQSNLKKEKKTS